MKTLIAGVTLAATPTLSALAAPRDDLWKQVDAAFKKAFPGRPS